uniref:Consortin, connexin sorting protein n=1 Tax=Nothobranchius furzeri TaxID=105023 RepID=A0A1A8AIZ4_NOTFU
MGNKNTSLPRGPDAVPTLKEQAVSDDVTGLVSTRHPLSLSPELLASLQHLRENHDDYCLLPQSLHQTAEVFSLKGDYQWAIHFLQLEKMYHERLLSNLASLQEDWERQLRENDSHLTSDTEGISQKHMETLAHICRTHHRPAVRVTQKRRRTVTSCSLVTKKNCCPDGLVSILKRRRASLDGLPPASSSSSSDKHHSKRQVRFSEPDDGAEQDEVGGDSCLILLLLCLLTVVISVGGTALYCTLVDTYATICTDFTHNMDFYVSNARALFQGFGWLPSWT